MSMIRKSAFLYKMSCSMMVFIGLMIGYFATQNDYSFSNTLVDFEHIEKHRGATVFGVLDTSSLDVLRSTNVDWISLVPYAGQRDFDTGEVYYARGDSLQNAIWDSIWTSQIDLAYNLGFKVMLKPHVWLDKASEGKWRSDIYPRSESEWESWQKSYKDFILYYAEMAQRTGVDMFCVGTEFSRLTLEKSVYWVKLIEEIRQIYSGQLTYAANWYGEYQSITFWDQLDVIGVQAYFPLTNHSYPSQEDISVGWKRYISDLEKLAHKTRKKILFTEVGYKSTADAAIRPWEWIDYEELTKDELSFETQAHCYQAIFEELWDLDWFGGMHIWQWRSDFEKGRGKSDYDFTPQGKPAQEVLRKGFDSKTTN